LVTDGGREAIEDVFIFVMDEMELSIERLKGEASTPAATKEQASAAPAIAQPVAQAPQAPAKTAETATPATDNKPQQQAKAAENVRVPAERLDELMDRVGELVIAQSRLPQLADATMEIQL